MKHFRLAKLSLALLALAYWLGPAGADPSLAQAAKPEVIKTEYQYAAKVVCSLMLPHQDGTLAKGIYRTIVNLHNPGEGFVVIKSPEPLDVVSVYSARHGDGEVETMDVDAVQPRQMREAVEIVPAEPKSEIKERKEYPSKESPAYGKVYSKKMCGGIAGIPCPKDKKCVDDPSDTCDPAKGGADCPGICVSEPAQKQLRH